MVFLLREEAQKQLHLKHKLFVYVNRKKRIQAGNGKITG